MTSVVVVGEALADLVGAQDDGSGAPTYTAHPGGGPYNAAVALARLGVEVHLRARLSDDRLGRLLRDRLDESGVRPDLLVEAAEPTPVALADVDAEGRASYGFHLRGTAAFAWTDDEVDAPWPDGDAVLVGTLALATGRAADRLVDRVLAERGRRALCLDPNVRPAAADDADAYRARLDRLAAEVDVVKASDEDLEWWTGQDDPGRAADGLLARGAGLVVVTRGPDPVLGRARDVEVEVEVPPVDVVDTVGAGDTLVAGLLAGLAGAGCLAAGLPGLDAARLRDALAVAVAASGAVVGRAGADPPRRGDLDAEVAALLGA